MCTEIKLIDQCLNTHPIYYHRGLGMLHVLYRSLRHPIVLSCTRILRPPVNHIKDLVGSGSNTVIFLKNSLRVVPHFPHKG